MRLALIGPVYPYRGGIAHYTTALHRAIREAGHSILMISFSRQYPDWLFPGHSDRDPSISHEEVVEAKYWIDSVNPLTWLRSWRNMEKYEPEVIVMQWWTPWWAPAWFVIGYLNQLFNDRPLLFLCHNVLPHENRWWDPILARSVLRRARHFVVHSRDEKQRLLELLPTAEVTVSPLPILELYHAGQVTREEARVRLDLPIDSPVLLFFGIVRAYKGLQDLLTALGIVRKQLKDVQLVVAGEFWEDETPYRTLIDELGISQSVRIDNRYIPNEEANIYFSAADLLVAPYRQVTGSAVVQLARGFGLPVVTTAIGALAEAADNAGSSLVPPRNPEQLAKVIIRCFEDGLRPDVPPVVRKREGRASWQQLVATIESLGSEHHHE